MFSGVVSVQRVGRERVGEALLQFLLVNSPLQGLHGVQKSGWKVLLPHAERRCNISNPRKR